jgi:pimeloyl-ACP methyl ester carboxylesterase
VAGYPRDGLEPRTGRSRRPRQPGPRLAALPPIAVIAVLAVCMVLAGCTAGSGGAAGSQATVGGGQASAGGGAHGTAGPPAAARLAAPHSCPGAPGFTCTTLRVPLDHTGRVDGQLSLQVAVQSVRAAPRGDFLLLSGGPGQPGVPFASRLSRALGPALHGYRFVVFDQRGTGGGALQCPALQRVMGGSDLQIPPPAAVTACAAAIGDRRQFFGTTDTVADIDALRSALGAQRLTLDGISYGSYVAERYALAHPGAVSRLILDSVVPQAGADPWELANIQATARVLRTVCRSQRCGYDPADDLAAVVAARHDGPALLNTLVLVSVVDPSFRGVLAALHQARQGSPAALGDQVRRYASGGGLPASELSQGLHASTLCEDLALPWGSAATPLASRPGLLARAAARLSATQTWPFDRASAMGNGLIKTCLYWPPEPAESRTGQQDLLPRVPVLLLAGQRDLSTPVAWAREEAAHAPDGHLIVVPGHGHAIQAQPMSAAVMRDIQRFLGG